MTEPEQQPAALVENMLLLRRDDFDELLKAGFTAAKLSGGISSWKADNLPLVK